MSCLPIGYYGKSVLAFIGDHIWKKTIKIDKSTLTRERGKYAQLRIQVDLTKPLLAMFSIKGKHYKVEYEGFHLLCLTCGRFRRHVKVCGEKKEVTMMEEGLNESIIIGDSNKSDKTLMDNLGPYLVVQKIKRSR
ncbi:unnamed protein product [Lathyrus sativus]|nr:unnamed protein product [Lathyrus sativus]